MIRETASQRIIYKALLSEKHLTIKEIEKKTGYGRNTIPTMLQRLRLQGKVSEDTTGFRLVES